MTTAITAGKYHHLKAVKKTDFGWYLDGGNSGEILLPNRYVPENLEVGDEIRVFIYHDNESRLIATTAKPLAVVGDIAALEVVDKNEQGAFMEWGLMKHLFLPLSQQHSRIYKGEKYLVYLYVDEQTGRVAATEKFARLLKTHTNELKAGEEIEMTIWAVTDLGFRVIVNNEFQGLAYHSDFPRVPEIGDQMKGYVKTVRADGKLDVVPGVQGHARVTASTDVILEALRNAGGYLPYSDKTDPETIAQVFGMSKKVFKMALGALYRQRLVELTKTGIKLVED